MVAHIQTGRTCEEQCIHDYHTLVNEKRMERENNAGRKVEGKKGNGMDKVKAKE